jgi:predicted metal-dependent HD superfamily phosphohydrolase
MAAYPRPVDRDCGTRDDVLDRCWPERLGQALRARLEEAYAGPGRRYHDLQHLTEVLTHVEELLDPRDPAREPVVLAAWFHDAVHEGREDDEERSAAWAEAALAGREATEPGLAAEVARLVRVTARHRPAEDDLAGQVLCDADLAVLAADPQRYTAYVEGVRHEYAHVPDDAFATGRAAVLRDLLAGPLFHTAAGRQRWEQAARANVEAEITRLDSR